MLHKYLEEIAVAMLVGFMVFYPPEIGALVFALALSAFIAWSVLKSLDRKKSPDLTQVELDIKELKSNMERLLLKGGR